MRSLQQTSVGWLKSPMERLSFSINSLLKSIGLYHKGSIKNEGFIIVLLKQEENGEKEKE